MEIGLLVVEEFCTRYNNFKNSRPNAKKAQLKEAFDRICSSVYTKFAPEMPALDIHDIKDFKSFLAPNLKKRREFNKVKNEEREIYFEIQQELFAIQKAKQEREALEIKREFDKYPTFMSH
ncbi:MAG: hypothetical protein KBB86_00020 [Candidatus Pacebacteria bacterium]|nr:hypothetical protein [Candidatus Paceibacterota bacterium]